jgi:hypothetical protein
MIDRSFLDIPRFDNSTFEILATRPRTKPRSRNEQIDLKSGKFVAESDARTVVSLVVCMGRLAILRVVLSHLQVSPVYRPFVADPGGTTSYYVSARPRGAV